MVRSVLQEGVAPGNGDVTDSDIGVVAPAEFKGTLEGVRHD